MRLVFNLGNRGGVSRGISLLTGGELVHVGKEEGSEWSTFRRKHYSIPFFTFNGCTAHPQEARERCVSQRAINTVSGVGWVALLRHIIGMQGNTTITSAKLTTLYCTQRTEGEGVK